MAQTWVAFLRGVNVGGRNVLRMAELRSLLASTGLGDVRTYIQSGNVVFRSDASDPAGLASAIAGAVEAEHDFSPQVMVLRAEELAAALTDTPWPDVEAGSKALHLWFLAEPPLDPDLARLEAVAAPGERFALAGRVFYLHAPDGIGRSKLAERVERVLGVAATARNGRTVAKVLALANQA
jgi:uncharacterized protein (DUF1697 family)